MEMYNNGKDTVVDDICKDDGLTEANAECGVEMEPSDAFKARFKWFKTNADTISYEKVEAEKQVLVLPEENKNGRHQGDFCKCGAGTYGLKPAESWKVSKLRFPEGLVFIENPFTVEGQRYWISRCLKDYIKSPYVTNISNLERKTSTQRKSLPGETPGSEFYKKLRWVTFGYHHNWDTKIYSEDHKCEFPNDLADLTMYMARILGFQDFKAEAAIVNYYNLDSTLSGHQDRSEKYTDAPLFSISFGQTAVFLIGGEKKNIKPLALYIKSGDVVIMAGKSRHSFHGVPKILKTSEQPWNTYKSISDSMLYLTSGEPSFKKSKTEFESCTAVSECHSFLSEAPISKTNTQTLNWDIFSNEYASRCRINLNIRQVLIPGNDKIDR